MKKAIEDFNKAYDKGDIFHEYLAFSQFFQRAFISEKAVEIIQKLQNQ